MFEFRKNRPRILNLFLAQEMFTSFSGLYFTSSNSNLPVVMLKAPAKSDTNKQKSINASKKKDNESKVRKKRKSRKEAKEDENLAKRIMIEGGDIDRNERQQEDRRKFQDGSAELALLVPFPNFQGQMS